MVESSEWTRPSRRPTSSLVRMPPDSFTPRSPMDTTTSTGDLPLGIALHEEPGTDRARVYIMNEVNRTVSHLEVDFANNAFAEASPQIKTLLTTDAMSFSERLGLEIFEDASRKETTGNFNNSCRR